MVAKILAFPKREIIGSEINPIHEFRSIGEKGEQVISINYRRDLRGLYQTKVKELQHAKVAKNNNETDPDWNMFVGCTAAIPTIILSSYLFLKLTFFIDQHLKGIVKEIFLLTDIAASLFGSLYVGIFCGLLAIEIMKQRSVDKVIRLEREIKDLEKDVSHVDKFINKE